MYPGSQDPQRYGKYNCLSLQVEDSDSDVMQKDIDSDEVRYFHLQPLIRAVPLIYTTMPFCSRIYQMTIALMVMGKMMTII